MKIPYRFLAFFLAVIAFTTARAEINEQINNPSHSPAGQMFASAASMAAFI
jgi:hypothetical protein